MRCPAATGEIDAGGEVRGLERGRSDERLGCRRTIRSSSIRRPGAPGDRVRLQMIARSTSTSPAVAPNAADGRAASDPHDCRRLAERGAGTGAAER